MQSCRVVEAPPDTEGDGSHWPSLWC